jgi:hypothetical protein
MTPLVFTDQSDITEVNENSTNYYASQIKNTWNGLKRNGRDTRENSVMRNLINCILRHIPVLFPYGTTAHVEPCPPLYWGFLTTHNYIYGRTPLDGSSARCSGLYLHRTTQHINTRDKRQCPERDSNPRSQQPSGCRPRPRGHWDRPLVLLQ